MVRGIGVVAVFLGGLSAVAELQEVEVGGSIEIYGNYYSDFYENGDPTRLVGLPLLGRPIGTLGLDPDSGGLASAIRAYGGGGAEGLAWVEQRTSLYVRARFSDAITSYIAFDSITDWGTGFRANYVTDIDTAGNPQVDLYQAYIDVDDLWGTPLRLRIGRQELRLGNEWLVGNQSSFDPITYLSFDGIRLSYTASRWSADGFWMKLNEQFRGFGDGDAELYGLYGTYHIADDHALHAYWLLVRDGAEVRHTRGDRVLDWLEDAFGVDDYGRTAIHTVGLRVAGALGAFEYDGEVAYQFGAGDSVGSTFAPFVYGDNRARYDVWAGQFSLGYTFDVAWSPYVYLGGEYYGGEDNRERRLGSLLNPFHRPQASLSFNRLFSSWEVDWFLDGGNLSNLWLLKTGISATPTEKLEVGLDVQYFETNAAFRTPVLARVGRDRAPITGPFPWNGRKSRTDLGVETTLWFSYAYSDDLQFEAGWAHFFTGDGLKDGNFVDQNGLAFFGGLDDDDADYLYAGTTLRF